MSSLKFIKAENKLICQYSPDWVGLGPISSRIKTYGIATIRRLFKVTKEDLRLSKSEYYYKDEFDNIDILDMPLICKQEIKNLIL